MQFSRSLGFALILLAGSGACDSGTPPPAKPTPEVTKAATPPPPATPAPGTWAPHTSKGGFTVELPGTPTLKDAKAGGIAYHEAEVKVPGRDVSITVIWSPLPGEDVEVGDTEGMLDAAVEGLIKGAGGTMVGEAKLVNVDHHPGRDFTVTAPVDGKPNNFRVWMLVVHDRLFRIVVRTGEKEDYTADADKIIRSFALTPEYAAEHAEVVKFDWQPFTSPDGGFTAKFPVAKPRVTTDDADGLAVTTVVGSAHPSYAVFVIGHFEVPADASKLKAAALFDKLREGVAVSTGAVLVGKAESAPLGKIPGEKYLLESDGGLMHVEGRTYLIGKQLFFLQAQRPKNSPAPQSEFDTFFASFVPAKK